MWDSIPGPGGHALSQRQDAQPLSHPGTQHILFLVIHEIMVLSTEVCIFFLINELGEQGKGERESQVDFLPRVECIGGLVSWP